MTRILFLVKKNKQNMAEKKRSCNFSSAEVIKLVEIVTKHKDVVENKKSDVVFNKKKNEEWQTIADEFNSTGICARSVQALRTKYENIKKTTKKKFAAEKQQLYATGGGLPAPSQITSVDETLRSMLTTQITGLPSCVDSDSTNLEWEVINTLEMDEVEMIHHAKLTSSEVTDVSKSPCETKAEVPRKHQKRKNTASRNCSNEKWKELADKKMEVTCEKQAQQKQQYELTLDNMAEQHKMQMEVLQLKKKKLLLEIELMKQ